MTQARARILAGIATAALMLGGCAAQQADRPAAGTGAPAASPAPSAALAQFFDKYDAASLSLLPLAKAYRGIRDDDYGAWDREDEDARIARQTLMQATAASLSQAFPSDTLNPQDALSKELFLSLAEQSAASFRFRDHGYLFNQMNGAQSQIPAFLINIHRVANEAEAKAYIQRLDGLGPQLDVLTQRSAAAFDRGIQPPKWVYPFVLSDIDNLFRTGRDMQLSGQPLLDDFRSKISRLDLSDEQREALNMAAVAAWTGSAGPAYQRLRAEMVRQQALAPTTDGVWRLPDGAAYYQMLLRQYTSTDMTAEQVHQLGLDEVARIHGEMRAIMARVGFSGSLQDFFAFVRTSPQFYHDTREGYIAETEERMAAMTTRLPDYFGVLPKSELAIKPVEAFREKSAGKAFYQSPAPDGSRPGTYYVNLYNLRDMPRTELEALAYHEGVPGHHLQRAIQTELKDIPAFRRFAGFTAYTEGWGLYSERLGKDMGFYTDPYSDFGRLAMELWRACRLVVDTGLHHKRWSREKAIQYLTDNTPNPAGDISKAIERYIVYPGQATAYTVGMLKILELRQRAKDRLGARFDYRRFHDAVLTAGPMPLDVLDRRIDAWIADGG